MSDNNDIWNYYVIPTNEKLDEWSAQAHGEEKLSLDGTMTILKFVRGNEPPTLTSLGLTIYSHETILAYINNNRSDWEYW